MPAGQRQPGPWQQKRKSTFPGTGLTCLMTTKRSEVKAWKETGQ